MTSTYYNTITYYYGAGPFEPPLLLPSLQMFHRSELYLSWRRIESSIIEGIHEQ